MSDIVQPEPPLLPPSPNEDGDRRRTGTCTVVCLTLLPLLLVLTVIPTVVIWTMSVKTIPVEGPLKRVAPPADSG